LDFDSMFPDVSQKLRVSSCPANTTGGAQRRSSGRDPEFIA
jgi:hypothetical protein